MNKKIGFVLSGLVFILLIALVAQTAYFLGKKNQSVIQPESIKKAKNDKRLEDNEKSISGKNTGSVTGSKSNNVKKTINNNTITTQKNKLDDSWFWYVNEVTGFKIKLPKETNLDEKKYKVKIFIEGPITYISSSKPVEKEILKRRDNKVMSIYDKAGGVAFAILTEKVKDKKDLEQFIKNRYDKGCKLGNIVKTSTPGIFDVGIKGAGEPGGACFINYMTVIKYSPDKNMVAAWDIGQAPNFWIDEKANPVGSNKSFDMIISDSFNFLK